MGSKQLFHSTRLEVLCGSLSSLVNGGVVPKVILAQMNGGVELISAL